MGKSVAKPRWQACNIFGLEPAGPKLWQVNAAGGRFTVAHDEALLAPAAIQPKLIVKDWNELVRPRLNIALLPPSQVFIRVVQLPKVEDFEETLSMLEFQLEKLSPLPVAQIVWTFELAPSRGLSETQTAVLVVVSRQIVEEFLGKLEGFGYLADRIEVPFIDQLLALEVSRDSVLLFPSAAETPSLLWAAWWYGGSLQNIALIHLPSDGHPAEVLKAQLGQIAWAGELEGWLTSPPRFYMVADEPTWARWQEWLKDHFDPPVEYVPSATPSNLLSMTAKRAVQSSSKAGLLPLDFKNRYRQQFIDRLWMQGLFGVLALYLLGLLAYFGIVAFKGYQQDELQAAEIGQGNAYTNAVRLHDQVKVLQEQVNLQFAALNCYLMASTNLPTDLNLESLNFDRGTRLTLYGNGGPEAAPRVFDFNAALKQSKVGGQPVFKSVEGPTINLKPGGAQISWNFSCELRRPEVE